MSFIRTILYIGLCSLSYQIVSMDEFSKDMVVLGASEPAMGQKISTAYKSWSSAERLQDGTWDNLISHSHTLAQKLLSENLFKKAQETLDSFMKNVSECNEHEANDTISTCSKYIQDEVMAYQANNPNHKDTILKYQILFWFINSCALEKNRSDDSDNILALEIKKTLQELVTMRFQIHQDDKELLKDYLSEKPHVRTDVRLGGISTQEHTWLNQRLESIVEKQQELFKTRHNSKKIEPKLISKDNTLRIGVALSGGGYRAMTLSAGFLDALEKLRLLDSTLYISSLSGSTWFVAPWLLSGKTVNEYRKILSQKIPDANIMKFASDASSKIEPSMLLDAVIPSLLEGRPFYDALNYWNLGSETETHLDDRKKREEKKARACAKLVHDFALDVLIPKIICGKPVSGVDMYGALIAYALLTDLGKPCNLFTLNDIAKSIHAADKPLPLFTAVSDVALATGEKKNTWYNWYEFTPYSVENVNLTLAVPGFTFGSKFNRGIAKVSPHQESLGSLMGVWGSAWTVNFADDIDSKHVPSTAQYGMYLASYASTSLAKLQAGKKRFYSYEAHNPLFNLTQQDTHQRFDDESHAQGITQNAESTFVDAGIDFNLPILPLLKRMRELDVIIVGDASKSPHKNLGIHPKQLGLFFEKAQHVGVYYEKLATTSSSWCAYKPIHTLNRPESFIGDKLPVIIYFNFIKDNSKINTVLKSNDEELKKLIKENHLEDFDERKVVNDYADTLSFSYSNVDFNQLAAMGEFTILAHKAELMDIITNVMYNKLERKDIPLRSMKTNSSHVIGNLNIPIDSDYYGKKENL